MNNNRKCSTAAEMHLVKEVFPGYFVAKVVNNMLERTEVATKCYPFTMDDVKLFAHRCIDNPKIWVVTELSTGLRVTNFDHSTKKAAITEVEDIIRGKPQGWLKECSVNYIKYYHLETPVIAPAEVIPVAITEVVNNCNNCEHTNCKLLENGMSDLCKGKGLVQKGTITPSSFTISPKELRAAPAHSELCEHDRRTAQAAKEIGAALNEWIIKYGKKETPSHNFEWEAEMDCLMAPPASTPEQTPKPETGRLVEVYDYVPSGDKVKKVTVGHAELIPLERREFPSKTIFPPEFPTPIVCQEFCDKHSRCHLREESVGDLCKNNSRFGKLVHPIDKKWSAWNDFKNRPPKTEFVHSTRTGTAPEIALAHWGSPDARMNDNGNNGDDEYISPQEQAREIGDKDAIRFVPAYIFGAGKAEWRAVTAFDKQGYPYRKMVKYPSIRPIACRVKLKNGYVIPAGKAGSALKITTRADKKRIRAYSEIRKELTPYVGAERAGKMAGQQVAAMATC